MKDPIRRERADAWRQMQQRARDLVAIRLQREHEYKTAGVRAMHEVNRQDREEARVAR